MPYEWRLDADDKGVGALHLWPHRSLPRRGFAAFILATFTLITIPLYPLLGSTLLWGLLPFLLLAVAGLWWALEKSYRDAEMHEDLTLDHDAVHLRRVNPKGDVQEWHCETYWAKVEIHETGGPVPHYLTMKGKGRQVEIGAFLSEDERKVLYPELLEALRKAAGPQVAE